MEEEIKSQEAEERHQKLVNEFRKLGEEYAALQVCIKGFSSRIWQITSMTSITSITIWHITSITSITSMKGQ